MYAVGTLVLYSRMGVCRVESIGAAPSPQAAGRSYYKLRSVFSSGNELVIYAPVDTAIFMRPLISGAEAVDYLERFPCLEPQGPADAAGCQELLDSCRLESWLLLLRELYGKRRELARRRRRLAQAEEQCLKVAERLVCEEFAAVLHTTPEVIREQLCTAAEPKQITA